MGIKRWVVNKYASFMDKYFPDQKSYLGKDFEWCATDDWGSPCNNAELHWDEEVAICTSRGRRNPCSNRSLASKDLAERLARK